MDSLRVPQRHVEARVALCDGRELFGTLFASDTGPGGRPGRLLERLNDRSESFFPLVEEQGSRLLRKGAIVSVTLSGEHARAELPDADTETGRRVRARVRLSDGSELGGEVPYSMPPERERLLDYVNAGERFVPFQVEDVLFLINRDFVIDIVEEA